MECSADQLLWQKTNPPSSPGGDYTVEIKKTTYLQLWNPTDHAISSGSISVKYTNTDSLKLGPTGSTVV